MQANTARTLATFVASARFESLPPAVVHETKRILLDVIGCTLGAHGVAKGRLAMRFALDTGGPPQASILGTPHRVGLAAAAFANGELMHGVDACPLLPPGHITPYVTAAPLALAQADQATGRTLILAVALAHEVASRIGVSLDPMRAKAGGLLAPTWGLGFNAFGAAAGAGSVLGLDATAMNDALGLAAYCSPVPSHNKALHTTAGGGLAKYGPAGWTAQAGVTAAQLAKLGYEADRSVLDGEYGYWAMAGSKACRFDAITQDLGREWNLLRVLYKYYPMAGLFQSPLGAFAGLVDAHALQPQEIERVEILNEGQGQLPRFRTPVHNHVDAQNSLPYGIAIIAHRIPRGPQWQHEDVLKHPGVQALMDKVTVQAYDRAEQTRLHELEVQRLPYIDQRPCVVDVTARGRVFRAEANHARWLSSSEPAFRATDADLAEKFRANAGQALGSDKTAWAIEQVMQLEQIDDVDALISGLVR